MMSHVAATSLPAAIAILFAIALATGRRVEAAGAFALSLPAIARLPDAGLVPAFMVTLADLAALALVMHVAIRSGRRHILLIAALALIAVVAGILAHAGIGLAPWQHRIITLGCWTGAALALAIGLAGGHLANSSRDHNTLR